MSCFEGDKSSCTNEAPHGQSWVSYSTPQNCSSVHAGGRRPGAQGEGGPVLSKSLGSHQKKPTRGGIVGVSASVFLWKKARGQEPKRQIVWEEAQKLSEEGVSASTAGGDFLGRGESAFFREVSVFGVGASKDHFAWIGTFLTCLSRNPVASLEFDFNMLGALPSRCNTCHRCSPTLPDSAQNHKCFRQHICDQKSTSHHC